MSDDSNTNERKCVLIKKLYFHNPYISIPSFLTKRLGAQWMANSNQQMVLMIQWLITQDNQFQQQLLAKNKDNNQENDKENNKQNSESDTVNDKESDNNEKSQHVDSNSDEKE